MLLAGLLGLCSCGEPATDEATSTVDRAARRTTDDGPPGFLDPAPPPPESATLILSGGTLLGAAVAETHPEGLFDAIVVIRDGRLIGFGRRGSLEVPADSVGIDTSGQFMEPNGAFTTGAPVSLNVYGQRPEAGSAKPPLTARFADGSWQPLINGRD